jgi:hypothetical protein
MIRNFWGNGCTSRTGMQNAWYISRALSALLQHPDGQQAAETIYSWLNIADSCEGKRRMRRTILAELGRIGDPDTIRHLAEIICRDRYSTEEPVRKLRL